MTSSRNLKHSERPAVALIAGPTASGKSALALRVAEMAGDVIINADSAQVYRDLRIVTARPTPEDEEREVHLLYGYRDAADPCSAAEWAVDARAAIDEVLAATRMPILVGGSGLYLRTLLDGIAPIPEIRPDIRAAVRAMAADEAHALLRVEDPAAAQRIRPSDTTRAARALEVVRSTGRPLSAWQRERIGGIGDAIALRPLVLLPPRDWLYGRCDARFDAMMTDQGIEEVRALLARNLSPLLPAMRAIGVPQIAAFLSGEIDRDTALALGRTATRQYAKRQYTWFSRQAPADWPRFTEPLESEAIERAVTLLYPSID